MRILLVGLLVVLLSGCSSVERVSISGSSTVLPIVAFAAEEYVDVTGTEILVNGGGSGVGVKQAGSGVVDIGMSSRALTAEEMKLYPGLQVHLIGQDTIAAVVSSEIYEAGIESLTVEQIQGIYLGTIANWKDVGGPDRDILVIDKEQSRGTRHAFMEAIFGESEIVIPGADLVLGSNNEEQTALTQSDAGIGMLSVGWVNGDVRQIAIIGDEEIRIARGLYLLTQEPTATTQHFLDFIRGEQGKRIVRDAGYVAIE